MDYVKSKGNRITFQVPGDIITNLKGAEGIKFYILGPPRDNDLKFIKIETKEEEMYKLAAGSRTDESIPDPFAKLMQSGVSLRDRVSPFSDNFQMSNYETAAFMKVYNNADLSWRQIETDWLESPGGLALALNRFTNNTSLAMALEFENTGNVILLPADAQSGNWISWQKPDVMESLKTKGGKDTNELLANTTFYKVGHHGSHNGTASTNGLEKIMSKNLVVFMPLIKNKVPAAWHPEGFPATRLYQKLIDKSQGRVIRTDEGLINDSNAAALRSASAASGAPHLSSKAIGKPGLYHEYIVHALP